MFSPGPFFRSYVFDVLIFAVNDDKLTGWLLRSDVNFEKHVGVWNYFHLLVNIRVQLNVSVVFSA